MSSTFQIEYKHFVVFYSLLICYYVNKTFITSSQNLGGEILEIYGNLSSNVNVDAITSNWQNPQGHVYPREL